MKIIKTQKGWNRYIKNIDAVGNPRMIEKDLKPREPYKYLHIGDPFGIFPCLVRTNITNRYSVKGQYICEHFIVQYNDALKLVNIVEEQTR